MSTKTKPAFITCCPICGKWIVDDNICAIPNDAHNCEKCPDEKALCNEFRDHADDCKCAHIDIIRELTCKIYDLEGALNLRMQYMIRQGVVNYENLETTV